MKEANSDKMKALAEMGQSIWLDSISRDSLLSGELAHLIEQGLRGETANPTIFEKAISSSSEYDERTRELVKEERTALDIYEALLVRDVQMALDLFRPVYDRLEGVDGFVSLEVSPELARDTQGTIAEVRRFWKWVDRPNLMVKIPGTLEGVPAIEEMLYEGVNINITLLFAIEAYEQVAWAYIRALERRAAEGKDIRRIASVASFFVSRIDTLADKLLDQKAQKASDPREAARLKALKGRAAIANAKLAYEQYTKIFGSDRFRALAAKGARVQRPLWASTSTKNPAYPDTLYVDALIGPDTINTLPLETIEAFIDHGKLERTVDRNLDEAREVFRELEAAGIHIQDVTRQVLDEGIIKFDESLTQLLDCIEAKRTAIEAGRYEHDRAYLGNAERAIDLRLAEEVQAQTVKKLWSKEPGLWTKDGDAAKTIMNRLGWLTVSKAMLDQADEVTAFASQVRDEGYTQVILLDLDGSSRGARALARVFGTQRGFPSLQVLDADASQALTQTASGSDAAKTLFLVSSKTVTAEEIQAQVEPRFARVQGRLGAAGAARNFVVITDAGTPLEGWGKAHNVRRMWTSPGDIGARYSALSFNGVIPAALIGVNVKKLLQRADLMRRSCEPCVSPKQNPGLWLGVVLGELARDGRDKVSLVADAGLEGLADWAKELLAESTGKKKPGLNLSAGEPLGEPGGYGEDSVFVYLSLEEGADAGNATKLDTLRQAGHPVVQLHLTDLYDAGAEFFRWQFATAIAGSILGVNPFEEPNAN